MMVASATTASASDDRWVLTVATKFPFFGQKWSCTSHDLGSTTYADPLIRSVGQVTSVGPPNLLSMRLNSRS